LAVVIPGRRVSRRVAGSGTQSSGTVSLPESQVIVVVPLSVPNGMMTGFGVAVMNIGAALTAPAGMSARMSSRPRSQQARAAVLFFVRPIVVLLSYALAARTFGVITGAAALEVVQRQHEARVGGDQRFVIARVTLVLAVEDEPVVRHLALQPIAHGAGDIQRRRREEHLLRRHGEM